MRTTEVSQLPTEALERERERLRRFNTDNGWVVPPPNTIAYSLTLLDMCLEHIISRRGEVEAVHPRIVEDPKGDQKRQAGTTVIKGSLLVLLEFIRDAEWHTLEQMARAVTKATGKPISETSVAARLRDLRKPHYGSHVIERKQLKNRVNKYRWVGRQFD
jgi:hypothetical protein